MNGGYFPQPLTPYYAFGILRVKTGAETAAEFRMSLADLGFKTDDCELWAQLFETFDGGFHTAASDELLRARELDYEAAVPRVFED